MLCLLPPLCLWHVSFKQGMCYQEEQVHGFVSSRGKHMAGQPLPVASVPTVITPTAQAYMEQVVSVPILWDGWCQQEVRSDHIC